MVGECFIVCGGFLWLCEVVVILCVELGEEVKKVLMLMLFDWIVWMLVKFSMLVCNVVSELGMV